VFIELAAMNSGAQRQGVELVVAHDRHARSRNKKARFGSAKAGFDPSL
jgi:hypothetical protein